MFFDRDRGLIVIVHQWSSWLLVIAAVGHIVTNFRPSKNHLNSRMGMLSVIAFSVVLIASGFSWGMTTGPQLKRPIEQALVDAPLSLLARMSPLDAPTVTGRLSVQGTDAESEQSIGESSNRHNVDENRLLALMFLPDEPEG